MSGRKAISIQAKSMNSVAVSMENTREAGRRNNEREVDDRCVVRQALG